jgi:DNA-binding transcriptional regulator YdaS (Cro superfamily)
VEAPLELPVDETAVQRAARIIGGPAALARACDVTVQAAYQWIAGTRPVPAERAPLIEQATGVPCEEICPNVPWDIVRSGREAQ